MHSEPARALEIFQTIPAGCHLHRAEDNRNAPHIRAGELVVVDTADRAPEHLGLHLIQWSNGNQGVMQLYLHASADGEPVVTFRPLNRPPRGVDIWAWAKKHGGPFMGDGPLRARYLPEKLAGRVLGIFEPGRIPVMLPKVPMVATLEASPAGG